MGLEEGEIDYQRERASKRHKTDSSHRSSSRSERHSNSRFQSSRRNEQNQKHNHTNNNRFSSSYHNSHSGYRVDAGYISKKEQPVKKESQKEIVELKKEVVDFKKEEVVNDDDDDDGFSFGMDEDEKLIEEMRKRKEILLKKFDTENAKEEEVLNSIVATIAVKSEKGNTVVPFVNEITTALNTNEIPLVKNHTTTTINTASSIIDTITPSPAIDVKQQDDEDEEESNYENFELEKAESSSITDEIVVAATTEKKGDDDMFDMFSATAVDNIVDGEVDQSNLHNITSKNFEAAILDAPPVVRQVGNLTDNWDDLEGYYNIVLGEMLDNRYHVYSTLGKGVFSSVVRAKDLKDNRRDVAIKIIRHNDIMYRAGLKELGILKKLSDLDPRNKKHVIKVLANFEHKNHLCMVFDSFSLNLREVVKKYGNNRGLNIIAVKSYAQQLLIALSLMKKGNILHADIKPDNILVVESLQSLQLCDLGSASDITENEITPYLVSRYYRAPEIILGMTYEYSIDMWSVCCTLFELYTGKILFPGRTNNQMLKLMMDLKGRFPNKFLRKGQFLNKHFDQSFNFIQAEQDKISGRDTIKIVSTPLKAVKDIKARLSLVQPKDAEQLRLHFLFCDLLERGLNLQPDKRIEVYEALHHPFISGLNK